MKKEERNLEELTEIWMAMERKTFAQREKAEKYYETKLLDPIIEDYKERNSEYVYEQVDYLIMSVGTSYEPLILNISLLQPQKILFLYTEETETTLNKIVKRLKLEAATYQKSKVDSTDSLSVYQQIKQAYLSWERPAKVYVDFTGGTKTMSAAAALAGTMIDVQMVYVGSNSYLTDFRKPAPGSEELFFVDNPIEVFGDLELEKIFTLIARYNYAGAAEKLETLKDNLPDPLTRQQIHFVFLLVKVYEYWDALEFVEANEMMEQLIKELRRDYRVHKKILMMDFQVQLSNQYKMLQSLYRIPSLIQQKKQIEILGSNAIMHSLMFTMYSNAMRRERQEKYDMATLLFYRLLEMIEQKRLLRYNIFVSRPDYKAVDYSKAAEQYRNKTNEECFQQLKQTNFQLKEALFSRCNDFLPSPIALLDGYLLLAALGDSLSVGVNDDPIIQLKRIRAMVSLRNNSIFAHGLGPVKKEDYMKFRNFVCEMFRAYCSAEQISFEDYEKNSAFLNPINSKYYRIMGDNQ